MGAQIIRDNLIQKLSLFVGTQCYLQQSFKCEGGREAHIGEAQLGPNGENQKDIALEKPRKYRECF